MSAPPQLPQATRIRFWAPVVHYGLAALLFAAAVFHVDLRLSSLDQTIIMVVAMLLVVAGTGVWIYFHHMGLKTFEAYLRSAVPPLLEDVYLLKQQLSPQTLDQISRILHRVAALEPVVARLAAGHPGIDRPPPGQPVTHPPVVPVDLATAKAEVKSAAADLVTALEVESKG